MDKDFKPVYVRGTKTGKGVIKTLEQLGGINRNDYSGCNPNNLYFICPKTHEIDYAISNTPYGNYLETTAEEIKPSRWRSERTEVYYTLDSTLDVIQSREDRDRYDDGRYACGNYFKTREEAEIAAEKIKKILLSE